nr:MAG TPA: hypothetical protein [Caudoviricetes sp.]
MTIFLSHPFILISATNVSLANGAILVNITFSFLRFFSHYLFLLVANLRMI